MRDAAGRVDRPRSEGAGLRAVFLDGRLLEDASSPAWSALRLGATGLGAVGSDLAGSAAAGFDATGSAGAAELRRKITNETNYQQKHTSAAPQPLTS